MVSPAQIRVRGPAALWRAWVPDADRRTAIILISSAALLVVYLYQGYPRFYDAHLAGRLGLPEWNDWLRWSWNFLCAALLLGAAPALVARLWLREPLASFGLQLGDWRLGSRAVAIAAVVLTPILWLNAQQPEFRATYPLSKMAGLSPGHFLLWEAGYLVFYLGWEIFFRGFLQLGLRERLGAFAAMMMQTLPSTVAHPGKPEGEMLAAIAAGIGFGALALRTRSFLWPMLLHFYVGAMTDLFCLLPRGL